MSKITFRGVFIRHIDTRDEETGMVARIHMTAAHSTPVAEALGWPEELADGFDSAKLSGELALSNMILTPNGELRQYGIDIQARDAKDFQLVRVSDEVASRVELRFMVRTGGVDAMHKVLDYKHRVGRGVATMKVDCAIQEKLSLGDGEAIEPETGEVLMRGDLAAEHVRERGTIPSLREMNEREGSRA
jgi:hypothetical protein